MRALRVRCWGVMRSDVFIDYLLDEGREVLADLRLEGGGELPPEVAGVDRHNTSHWVASAISSLTAGRVSLVRDTGRDGLRLVAATGRCKSREGRYATNI